MLPVDLISLFDDSVVFSRKAVVCRGMIYREGLGGLPECGPVGVDS
jgi:hypothetical protein